MPPRNQRRPAAALALVLAGALCGPSTGAEQAAPGSARAGFAVRPYLQAAGKSSMVITWTSASSADCVLRYGQGQALDRQTAVGSPQLIEFAPEPPPAPAKAAAAEARPAAPPPKQKHYFFSARLADLRPGTAYRYEVACAGQKAESTFRTVPEKAGEFSFIAYGDTRTQPEEHRKVAECFPKHGPAFIVHTGDMTDRGPYRQWLPQFFAPLAEVIGRVPIYVTRGNHEGDRDSYWRFFPPPDYWDPLPRAPRGATFSLTPRAEDLHARPGSVLWYSFDYGDAHFTCLDSASGGKEDQPHETKSMLEWCERDLAGSKAKWKIVFYHHPSYDAGTHLCDWGRPDYAPLFRKHGVDLVLTGHSHGYQRFKPMFTKGENDQHPITYVVVAGGGAPLHRLERDPCSAAAEVSDYSYLAATVSGDRFWARVLTPAGREVDRLAITKKDGRPDAGYLTGAVPEEGFGALRDAVRPSFKGLELSADPRPGNPLKVKFPLGAGDLAVKFNLHLHSRSARDYVMKPETVSGEAPAGGAREVELEVRLRKPSDYADPEEKLPPVTLECEI